MRFQLLSFAVVAAILSGCGSDSGGLFGKTVAEKNTEMVESYACNISTALNNANRTGQFSRAPAGYYTNSMTWDLFNPPLFDLVQERWRTTIDGVGYDLNVLMSFPRVGRNGIVFVLHGLGASLVNANLTSLRGPEEAEFIKRGYAVVYVGRRGNYGSSGSSVGSDKGYTSEDYTSQRVPITDISESNIRYQSASMVAALDRIFVDSRFRDYLGRMVLIGASGGSFTALYTAALSPVFKAAQVRGVVRTTGSNSQDYMDNAFGLAGERYSNGAYAGITNTTTLWYAGSIDAVSNPGQLACVFSYYKQRSPNPDTFYIVPGMDHGGFTDLWSPAIYPTFSTYMRNQGFPNF